MRVPPISDKDETLRLRARYVFPVTHPPLHDGVVTIRGGEIVEIGHDEGEALDLGNVAILPGLVNAHTHLEFSDLAAPLGQPGMPLAEWIRCVVKHRQQGGAASDAAVAAGLAESARCGVTTLGEIAAHPWPHEALLEGPLGGTLFLELIGLAAQRGQERLSQVRCLLDALPHGAVTPALSPHAPYTVNPALLEAAVDLSVRHNFPLAMHLAESPEELALLRTGSGPFRELLEELGAWDSTAIPRGSRPMHYLKILSQAPRVLVIHGHYLDGDELALLAERADTMSLVYCPRTHAYFGHRPYRLHEVLAAGVHVAVGTDSRASNPDLNLLTELRFLAERHGVRLDVALELGTLAGAEALGRQQQIGSLEPGKQADLCAVALPCEEAADPHELVLCFDGLVVATYCRGRRVHPPPCCQAAPRPPGQAPA